MSGAKTEHAGGGKRRTLLIFQVASQPYAVFSADVAEVLPMAELQPTPGAPKLLAGFLNLAGDLVPIVRLHHLFGLPETALQLWTPLVLLRGVGGRVGLLVDRVDRTLMIDDRAVLPLPRQHVTTPCFTGVIRDGQDSLLLLSPEKLLLEQERRVITEMQQGVQRRLEELDGVTA